MSWSIVKVGKPEALKRAIDVEVEKFSGLSKDEAAMAAPHLKGLLDMAPAACVVSLNAFGYGHKVVEKFVPDGLNVEIKVVGLLVE